MRGILVAVMILWAGLAQAQGDPVTNFEESDKQMNAAMADARASLPLFLANMTDGEGYGIGRTSLKVAFDLADGGAEIIWVGPFQWDGNSDFRGLLSNEPNFMGDLRAGDMVFFDMSMVRDWSWREEGGQMWGNYTTRVIIPHLSKEEAEELNALLSPVPVPPQW